MRPIYHKKADRLRGKATHLENEGLSKLQALKARDEAQRNLQRAQESEQEARTNLDLATEGRKVAAALLFD